MQSKYNNTREHMQYKDRRRMRRWQAARPQDANQGALQTNGARITITINLDLAPATPARKPWRAQQRMRRSDAGRDDAVRSEHRGRRGHGHRRAGERSFDERRGAAGELGARGYSRWNDHKAIRRWQGTRTRLESPIY